MNEIDTFDIEKRAALLDAWVETRRRIAALEAEAAGLLGERIAVADADIAGSPFHRDAIWRSMVAEYSAAGRISKGSAEYAFADAVQLRDMPALRDAFAGGLVTAGHVREVVRAADVVREAISNGVVPESTLGLYEQAVLVVAERETPARTRVHARQVASVLAEQTVRERHTRAMDERTVTVKPVGDGLALLTAVLPEYLAVAVMDRLTQLARSVVAGRGSTPADTDAVDTVAADATAAADGDGSDQEVVSAEMSDSASAWW